MTKSITKHQDTIKKPSYETIFIDIVGTFLCY